MIGYTGVTFKYVTLCSRQDKGHGITQAQELGRV